MPVTQGGPGRGEQALKHEMIRGEGLVREIFLMEGALEMGSFGQK